MWSGPSSSMTYSGTPRPCSAESSWSEVFQSRPAPIAEAASISGSKSRCTTSAETSKPPAEVDRADHRLDGVGEDRGLVAAAGRLLAAAELDVLAEADAAADLGQRAGVDDRGAQLGQPALGEVGVGAVERLGDDDAEHRVAEELQALVGRQAAVLVGVRAVGEGALEQLGVQDGIPERCSQLARSWSAGPGAGLRGPGDGRRGRRTGRTRRTHGAAGAWHRRRGWRRSPGSARRPSTASDGGACCCATSSASGQPLFSPLPGPGRSGRSCPAGGPGRVSLSCSAAARRDPPSAGRSAPRARGPGRPRAGRHTRRTVPGQSSWHSGWNGSASTTASRSSGSRSSRSSSSRLTSSSSLAVVGRTRGRRRRTAPGTDLDLVGDRLQAPHALALEPGRAPCP